MSDRRMERDERRELTRSQWFEHELGGDWVAQGDGTYRFAGTEAPLARDDSHEEAALLGTADGALERERHFPRLPWRRR